METKIMDLQSFDKMTEDKADELKNELHRNILTDQLQYVVAIKKATSLEELKDILLRFVNASLYNSFLLHITDINHALVLSKVLDRLEKEGKWE
jgi:hypothetical protein